MAEVGIVGAERPDGLELRTRGLASRGLPELCAKGLPPYLGQGWARVLAAVAQRLAASPGGGPGELALSPDVAVRLETAEDGSLIPLPPHGHTGTVNEWHRDVLMRLFPAAGS